MKEVTLFSRITREGDNIIIRETDGAEKESDEDKICIVANFEPRSLMHFTYEPSFYGNLAQSNEKWMFFDFVSN